MFSFSCCFATVRNLRGDRVHRCMFLCSCHPVHSNGDWRKSVRYTGDEALVRYFQYQDNNNLLDSDEEKNLNDQLMGYNSDSGKNSSHDDDETARTKADDDQQQQTQSIQLTSRYVQIYEPFSYFSSFSSVSKIKYNL